MVALAVYLDSAAERGQLVRELASQAYEHPDGSSWTYSRGTLDRWVRAYRDHGLDGLGLHHAPISASSVAIPSCWSVARQEAHMVCARRRGPMGHGAHRGGVWGISSASKGPRDC